METIVNTGVAIFLAFSFFAVFAGELLILEAKKSHKKIGIPLNGQVRNILDAQFAIHIIGVFFATALSIILM